MKAAIIHGVNPFHASSLKPEKLTHTSVNARQSVVSIRQVIGSLTDRMIHVAVRAKANLTANCEYSCFYFECARTGYPASVMNLTPFHVSQEVKERIKEAVQ